MGEKANDEPTKYETLFGGKPLTVLVIDDTKRAATEQEVWVRQLPVKDYPAAFAAYGDDFKLAALYCGQAPGWAETLAPSSFNAVIAEGERVNADFFAYCERRQSREIALARRMPAELIEAALRQMRSPSPISSPSLPHRRD